jgi:hypothetical protein
MVTCDNLHACQLAVCGFEKEIFVFLSASKSLIITVLVHNLGSEKWLDDDNFRLLQ